VSFRLGTASCSLFAHPLYVRELCMPNPRITFGCAAVLLFLGPMRARAERVPASFAMATGQYGMRKESPHAVGIDLQLRPPFRWNLVRPNVGLLASADGGAFLYSGFVIEVPLPAGFQLNPGFAPGVVLAGTGYLGSPVEFRSSIEVAFSAAEALRLGIGFSHISNAGLAKRNPGVEVLMFSITFAVGK
jgi:hypothetical protein